MQRPPSKASQFQLINNSHFLFFLVFAASQMIVFHKKRCWVHLVDEGEIWSDNYHRTLVKSTQCSSRSLGEKKLCELQKADRCHLKPKSTPNKRTSNGPLIHLQMSFCTKTSWGNKSNSGWQTQHIDSVLSGRLVCMSLYISRCTKSKIDYPIKLK